jgi:hypothetical protein
VIKAIPEFTESLTRIDKLPGAINIKEKYVKAVKMINNNTTRKYNTWKLHVHKLTEIVTDKMSETYQIYVIDDNSKETLLNDRKFAADKVKELRTYCRNYHKENLITIDKSVIRLLWKEVNQKLVDPFAKVNSAMSTTSHKSQSANFYNVFVDMDDIFKNTVIDEAIRLLYTSCTRTVNELHIMI